MYFETRYHWSRLTRFIYDVSCSLVYLEISVQMDVLFVRMSYPSVQYAFHFWTLIPCFMACWGCRVKEVCGYDLCGRGMFWTPWGTKHLAGNYVTVGKARPFTPRNNTQGTTRFRLIRPPRLNQLITRLRRRSNKERSIWVEEQMSLLQRKPPSLPTSTTHS